VIVTLYETSEIPLAIPLSFSDRLVYTKVFREQLDGLPWLHFLVGLEIVVDHISLGFTGKYVLLIMTRMTSFVDVHWNHFRRKIVRSPSGVVGNVYDLIVLPKEILRNTKGPLLGSTRKDKRLDIAVKLLLPIFNPEWSVSSKIDISLTSRKIQARLRFVVLEKMDTVETDSMWIWIKG